jgi:ABC-type nitrate/sulfonate/bicarbonate transport system ATPase subunit
MDHPVTGAVRIDGQPVLGPGLAQLRATIAWADPQARLRDASLRENAEDGAASDAACAERRLAIVGLPADSGPESIGEAGSRLGTGDAQRLRLARALGRPNARLVLLDEALRGIPAPDRGQLLAHLRRASQHATLLYVTHDPREALSFDRVLVIADGGVIEDGDPHDLAARPASALSGLLDAERAIRARLRDPRRWTPTRPLDPRHAPPTTPEAGHAASPAPLAPRLAISAGLMSASLLAALTAAGLLLLAAARLSQGLTSGLDWLPGVAVLLIAASIATALGSLADGLAIARFGQRLRRRALQTTLSDDPDLRRGEALGSTAGRALDLETIERAAQGTMTLLTGGVAQLTAAGLVLALAVSPLADGMLIAAAALMSAFVGAAAAGPPKPSTRTAERSAENSSTCCSATAPPASTAPPTRLGPVSTNSPRSCAPNADMTDAGTGWCPSPPERPLSRYWP